MVMKKFKLASEEQMKKYIDDAKAWLDEDNLFPNSSYKACIAEYTANKDGFTLYIFRSLNNEN